MSNADWDKDPMQPLMTLEEVADLLSMDIATVRARIAAGDLRGTLMVHDVRVAALEVARYIRRQAAFQTSGCDA